MRTAKRILAEFMTVVMVLQACSPTVTAVAAGWQNISSEIAAASAEASDAAENGETKSDVTTGSGSSDTGTDSDSAGDDAAKDDAAAGDTTDSAAGSDSMGDQAEGDDTAGDAAADDAEQDADDATSEDAEAQAGATITDLKELVELLEANGAESIVLKDGENGIQSLDVTSSEAFAVLSNADASLYYDAQIKVNITGDAKLTEPANNGMSFRGLGSDERPFEGRIYRSLDGGGSPVELTTDRTVFNNLKLSDQNNTVKIKWVGATSYSAPMVASKASGAENGEESKTLIASVKIADSVNADVKDTTSALTAPLLGTTTGNLTANVTYSLYSPTGSRKNLNASATGNIGLIANTVESGTLTVESVTFPNDLASGGTVKTSSGNAGLLVGEVKDGATLSIGALTNVPTTTVQSTNGSAGGVVGLVGSNAGATVNVTKPLSLHTLAVKGTTASGGFIGQAINLSLSQSEGAKVTCPEHIGDSNSKISGGFIGKVSFVQSVEFTGNNQIDTGNGVTLAGAAHVKGAVDGAGSVFGVLALDDPSVSVSFEGGSFKSTFGDDASSAAFGGLIGFVSGAANSAEETSPLSLLKVEGVTTKFSLVKSPYFAGGIVGWLGTSAMPAALEINNATVNCTQVASTSNGFGGAVGCIDKNSVADVNGITVSNAGSIAKGAGIAAECWAATIRLGGVTDFSNMHFGAGNATAQIAMVRSDYPSLVFARGTGGDNEPTNSNEKDYWIYKRCKDAPKIDDLGGAQDASKGYGEVVRLDGTKLEKNLIQLNGVTHKPEGPSSTDYSWQVGYTSGADSDKWNQDHTLDIDSTQDFVALALSVQTGGLYNGVFGPTSNMADLLGSQTVINLKCDVDLSGTGIGGLGLDSLNNGVSFSGTFNGNKHKVTLAVGEPYGTRDGKTLAVGDTSDGNGKIYRHGRLGLFNAIGGGEASVNNLTIEGAVKFDNGIATDAGSLAGAIVGKLALSGVTCGANIVCGDAFGNDVNIGGVAGSVTAAASVDFGGNSKAQTAIATGNTLKGNTRIGGAIGYVGDVASTFNVTSLEVGGSFDTGDCADGKIAQVGGLIGCIVQSTYNDDGSIASSAVKYVNITGLAYDSFNMSVGKNGDRFNGDKYNGAGGLLGYSWGNAIVTIGDSSASSDGRPYALKTNETTVTANNSAEVGGLIYATSGHWIINDYAINLAGASFNADSATTFGVLIARGSTSDKANIYGSETAYRGLYLEDKASWETAYAVGRASIVASKVKTFDEWVANGVKPGSKLMDNGCNAIVSLHTQADTLDMSGDPAKDNSYRNRTVFGEGEDHKTNGSVRYYYNLDRALTRVKDLNASVMNTPEHLVLWAARKYAPSSTYTYLTGDKEKIFTNNVIGPKSGNPVTIDLTGYSYYPSNVSDNDVTIQNVEIIFCYSKIKDEQQGNKSNDSATQHENMHCGLIRTIGNRSLTVSSVTLSGTVGRAKNDDAKGLDPKSVSGALVLRCAYGASGDKKAAITIDTLKLNDLQVDGAMDKQYAPLLINAITRYVNLDVKNVTTSKYADNSGVNKTAASSLFGYLGYDKNSDQVTAKFERISLPSQKGNTIFTHASLLESFGYTTTGTADYTFTKADAVAGNVTYGSEIDAQDKGKEYPGKQLWYYDEATYGTPNGFVKVKDESADADRPWFSDYLPYVAKGKATENGVQYHEIKVNQRIPNFVTGCGTYGDPYAITSALEFNTAANYINNGTALDGWEVTIAKDQSTLCQRRNSGSTENEVTYVYKQANGATKKWEKKTGNATDPNDVLSDDTMRRYLQSAYYSIEPKPDSNNTIELDGSAFAGFGTAAYPFRGVIVGDVSGTAATIVIKNNTGSLRGLVPYSYGSVVRNLNIMYSDATASIAYASKNSDGVPGAFFGGVIGCIMGGDNIIDGVTVNASDSFSVAATASDKKSHLVPIGGYVGAIAGGGVIFRNSSGATGALNAWHDKGASLYDNPYVGRVIDGYAFSEGCTVDNGDDNYKINTLDVSDTDCVTTTDTHMKYSWSAGRQNNNAPQTTVKDSQGLLVLSAIINSGAGAGAAHTDEVNGNGTYRGSHAYEGSGVKGAISSTGYKFGNVRYGKVRNAGYTAVGKPADATAASDFQTSTNDDLKAPGNQEYQGALDSQDGQDINSPYLVKKYATDWRTGYVCAMGVCGMDLKFEQGVTYDMAGYGSGFLGLSGRYYSNACATDKKVNDKDFITPGIATINGNGATIEVTNNMREYVDDDYNVAGAGGLFSTIKFYSSAYNKGSIEANDNANVSNLNFKNCSISLTYVSSTGVEQSTSASNENSSWVGTGCLAGSTANQGASGGAAYGVFKSVAVSNSAVAGGCMAGGLIGSAGLMKRSADGSNGSIVNYGGMSSPVQLYDCSYIGITVSARSNAGGIVGYANSGACGVWVSNDKTVADSSTISIVEKKGDNPDLKNSTVGGIFGLTGGPLSVNTGQGDGASQVAMISDVSLIVNHNALGIGGIAGRAVNFQSDINRVKVTSTKKASEEKATYFGSLEAASDTKNKHAVSTGGIIGSALNHNMTLNSCTVENLRMGVTEHAGGLVGATAIGKTLNVTNATVDGVRFDGARCGGILGNCQDGGYENQGGTNVVVANTIVKNCSFGTLNSVWTHGDGILRNHSGGIVGAASGTIKIANVLISKNDFKQPGGQGFLVGDTAQLSSNFKGLYAAGVDIVLKDRTDNSSAPKPIKYFNDSAAADVNEKSYIAFGDYEDKLSDAKGVTLYGNDAATGNVTTAVSPYVTTSPTSGLTVRTSASDATDRYLFGDGMSVSLAETSKGQADINTLAETIKDQAGTNVVSRYTYTNIGGINDKGAYQNTSTYNAGSVESTFNANNDASGNQVTKEKNFPVLVISGTDNKTVTSYLNIITNGGFSDACRLNNENGANPHVTAKAEVFQLNNGVFVKDEEASNNPTLRVVNNGTNNMSFSPSSDWDNGKGRFTLLTVTFTEAGQSYNVQVPIIVKRKLEIDFTATYDYGTKFKESDYANLGKDAHVLTSFGEPMTGLLTWTYNSANGKEVDFGWDSYMAAGGSMKGLGKSILFNGADGRLPQGTQLTLIDANVDGKAGGREYHYTVGEGGATSVSLIGDAGFEDSAGNPYQERWLSEILDVRAAQDGAGTWTVCDNEAEATAKAKFKGEWTLFKVAGADVPSKSRYTLKVPKEEKTGREQRASESVYLVVNVPKSGDGMTQANINGFTASSIDSNSSGARISWNLHHVLRTGGDDNQNGTASTYSILSNYEQEVVDNKNGARAPVSKSTDGAAYVLSLNVTDTITFNPSQNYADTDSLFYQLDTSLCKYGANNNLTGVSSFPSGTSAIAKFYVAIGDQNYKWDGEDWAPCDSSTPAFTQTVTDTGDDSLKLRLDHDLAKIRKRATGGSFTVRTVVEEIRLTPDGCNKVISLSKQSGEDACTKMSYTAKLSTRKEGLNTSSLTQTERGNVGYYRMDKGDATIALSAPKKSQLGINVDDLRPIANGTIGLGATYELGGLNNAIEAIKDADSVVYTLTLKRRNGIDGSYEDVTDGISNYVKVTESKLAVANAAGNAITFTDSTKENGKFRTQNGDTTFNLPFTVQVNTQVEPRQFYANYRLVMTASLVTGGAMSATPQSPDYATYTLTRVNLNGIDH